MAPTGNGAVDSTLKATSELQSLRKAAPVSAFGLIARARADVDRLKTALESFGYYRAEITIKIDGFALNDVRLGDALNALPKGKIPHVAIGIATGPLYHLRRIEVDGELPDRLRGALGLASGAPAVAAAVLGARARLQAALQEAGYAFAKVDPPVAYEDQDAPVLDLSVHAVAGPRVAIGEIRFTGLERLRVSVVRRRLLLHTGEQYSASAVERARRDLLTLGVFASVSVQLGSAVDASGGVPVTFELRERPRHAVTVTAAYSSDLGGSGGVTWSDRDVFGRAGLLSVSASLINLGGTETSSLGYDTTVKYVLPDFGHRDQSLQLAVGVIKQSLLAYDQTAETTGLTLTRKLSSVWSASVGVSTAEERVIQDGVTRDYTLAALPLGVVYDSTDLASPLDDPRHGTRASVSVAPTRSIGHPNANFIISSVKAAHYVDLNALTGGDPGRSILAVRALAGLAQGAGEFSLPPDQRFYGGGSGTIRGYAYQAVGAQFTGTDIPIGGTAIIAGSVEFRQRVGTDFGVAVFVDGGQVSASLKPLPDVLRFGVGAGLRYYTPIGPIRFDLAVPTQRDSGDGAFQIYIGLGQAF